MNIDEFFGHMPVYNLHTDESARAAKCCANPAIDCRGDHCMAWRWLRKDGKPVKTTDDMGDEVLIGWCGLSAYPLIGETAC